MESDSKILFTDTNGFLQVRDLKDISWRELFPGVRTVDVMVAPRVIEELDKHKTSTNQRRRDRARAALQLIEKASLQPDLAVVLKEQPVRVRIVISNAPRFDWSAYPSLDPAKPDDQLVAEALSFGNGAEVFSHDAGPRIRARIAKIQAHAPPPGWMLPTEPSDDQRKITKLERALEQALSRSPKIIAGFDNIDKPTSELRLIRPVLQPLEPRLIDELVGNYLSKHPPASIPISTNNIMLRGIDHISEGSIERYHKDYSTFEAKVRAHFSNLHERVTRIGIAVAVSHFVKNESGTAAEGLRVEFDLEGAGSLLADRDDAEMYIGSFKMPKPPEAPRSGLDYLRSPLPLVPSLRDTMQPRDPVAFYWFDRPKVVAKHSALQCQDFRATREYRDDIYILTNHGPPVELRLRLHVSAANLPAPVNVLAKLIVCDQTVEWSDPVVQGILPKRIRRSLREISGI
jgi:hypothetical protein